MACVLTVAVVDNGDVVVGHVGDTRLYKIRGGRLQKITRDHSPVGEREDARELSEAQAMRHPRRNEVFRDVGSEPHQPDDPGFIDIERIPFERDAALLLCSDGLTDSVDSATINSIVETFAGHPHDVVRELIEAANEAGGKDNVTAVYVEGAQFATRRLRATPSGLALEDPPVRNDADFPLQVDPAAASAATSPRSTGRRWVKWTLLLLLAAVAAAAVAFEPGAVAKFLRLPLASGAGGQRQTIVVGPSESIASALATAQPGTEVIVEPGEYREALTLPSGVRLVSRVPRAATLRLSGAASDNAAVVSASGVTDAQFVGFRIVGDAATPMGTGIYSERADLTIVDVEISGAKNAAVEYDKGSQGALLGSDLVNNFGSALVVRAGASPRISHNWFARNASAETSPSWLIVESDTTVRFVGNVFEGIRPESFPQLREGNTFVPPPPVAPQPSTGARRGHK
jgi:hypothetical protein